MNKAKELAKYEIGWWEAYHKRNWSDLEKQIIALRHEQFGVEAPEAAEAFSAACKAYIQYKAALEQKDKGGARGYLKKAEEALVYHYNLLDQAQRRETAEAVARRFKKEK